MTNIGSIYFPRINTSLIILIRQAAKGQWLRAPLRPFGLLLPRVTAYLVKDLEDGWLPTAIKPPNGMVYKRRLLLATKRLLYSSVCRLCFLIIPYFIVPEHPYRISFHSEAWYMSLYGNLSDSPIRSSTGHPFGTLGIQIHIRHQRRTPNTLKRVVRFRHARGVTSPSWSKTPKALVGGTDSCCWSREESYEIVTDINDVAHASINRAEPNWTTMTPTLS